MAELKEAPLRSAAAAAARWPTGQSSGAVDRGAGARRMGGHRGTGSPLHPFSLAEIGRKFEELRDAPDSAEALSALFEEKIRVIDARMAELAALRADLDARVGTGCPLRRSAVSAGH